MILVLQDASTSDVIGEITDATSVPRIKSTVEYNATNYLVIKRISPTLDRDGVNVVRLRVREV